MVWGLHLTMFRAHCLFCAPMPGSGERMQCRGSNYTRYSSATKTAVKTKDSKRIKNALPGGRVDFLHIRTRNLGHSLALGSWASGLHPALSTAGVGNGTESLYPVLSPHLLYFFLNWMNELGASSWDPSTLRSGFSFFGWMVGLQFLASQMCPVGRGIPLSHLHRNCCCVLEKRGDIRHLNGDCHSWEGDGVEEQALCCGIH